MSYVDEVIERVVEKNPSQPEFHQAVKEVLNSLRPVVEANEEKFRKDALLDRIVPIGNAAGEGAKLCALSRAEFDYSRRLAAETEFLELAGLPRFQKRYLDALNF